MPENTSPDAIVHLLQELLPAHCSLSLHLSLAGQKRRVKKGAPVIWPSGWTMQLQGRASNGTCGSARGFLNAIVQVPELYYFSL